MLCKLMEELTKVRYTFISFTYIKSYNIIRTLSKMFNKLIVIVLKNKEINLNIRYSYLKRLKNYILLSSIDLNIIYSVLFLRKV